MRFSWLAACAALSGCSLDHTGLTPAPTIEAAGGAGGAGLAASSSTGSGAGGATSTGGGGGAPWMEGYAARKRLTFHPPPIGADLADFPAAVLLAEDADLAGATQPDGDDIAFTSDDATTRLSHEIESFEAATGRLAAWVRLPLLAASGPTDAFLYYGAPTATNQEDAAGTWAASTFAGVWHMDGDPRGPAPQFLDSTASANHGEAEGDGDTTSAIGLVAGALDLDEGDTIAIGDPADGSLDFGAASFGYSAWVLVTTSLGQYDMPWFKGGSSQDTPGYDLELGNQGWNAYVSDGTHVATGAGFGAEAAYLEKWTHLVAVVDREAGLLRTYANGIAKGTTDIAGLGPFTTSVAATMGNENYPFEGLLDEARVYSTPPTPDWIAVEHHSVTSPDFLVVSPPEQR